MKCFIVDVCIYSIILCFSDRHDSPCTFLVVMLIYIYIYYFIVLVIISVCVKCFIIDVRIYSTLLLPLLSLFVLFLFCFILAFLSF